MTRDFFALVPILLALMGMLAYIPGWRLLGSVRPEYIPMAPSTALSFLIFSLALFFVHSSVNRIRYKIIFVLIIFTILFNFLEIIGYILGMDLNFENQIVPIFETLNSLPVTRMSPISAAFFFFIGLGFLPFYMNPFRKAELRGAVLPGIMGTAVLLGSITFLLGYVFGKPLLYDKTMIPMALTTAMGFLFLSLGLIETAGSDRFPLHLFYGPSTHARLMRIFFPLSVGSILAYSTSLNLLPLLIDWNDALGVALFVVVFSSITAIAVNRISRTIGNQLDVYYKQLQQEIRERKQAEQVLKESEERYRTILQTAMDGFWLVDRQGRLLKVNETYCRMTGYSKQQLLSMNVSDLEIVETVSDVAAHIKKVKEHGQDRFETCHRRKDGTLFDVEVSAQYQPDDGGRIVAFIRDITEIKKMGTRIQQSQRMESIGNLAGGIAHDFNNLLFPIVGMAELLLEDLPADTPEYEMIQEILTAGKRGSDLVQQILAFGRQADHKKIPVQIQQILKQVIKLSRSTIPADIEILKDIQADCGLVMADPTQIHQIAMNLITNAYHAVEEKGGRISIQLKKNIIDGNDSTRLFLDPGQYAVLTVTDNGCGMPPDILDKIFDPYFTTKEKGKGTGLGLAVAYRLIKEHQGNITVQSEPGKGSIFNVYLPLLETPADMESGEMPEPDSTGSEKILLVDDEESIRKLLCQLLEKLGYQVTPLAGGMDALEAFAANPDSFDIVVSDMTMPNMTGDCLAKELMTIRPDIPVIICSGFSERMDKDKAKSIGAKAFLKKPVSKSDMARMIRKVLDEARQCPEY